MFCRSLVWCAAVVAVRAAEVGLLAGAAAVELRPPVQHLMAGYGARVGLSSGTLDPLHAKVLVLEGGGIRRLW